MKVMAFVEWIIIAPMMIWLEGYSAWKRARPQKPASQTP